MNTLAGFISFIATVTLIVSIVLRRKKKRQAQAVKRYNYGIGGSVCALVLSSMLSTAFPSAAPPVDPIELPHESIPLTASHSVDDERESSSESESSVAEEPSVSVDESVSSESSIAESSGSVSESASSINHVQPEKSSPPASSESEAAASSSTTVESSQSSMAPPVESQVADDTNTAVPTAAEYIGNRNSKIFHYPSCSSVDKMSTRNRVSLASREEAINSGYTPCKRCHP